MTFAYTPETIDDHTAYVVAELRAGHGVMITMDPRDGTFTGLVGIESGTGHARQIAERAERRASTLNTI